MAGSMGLHEAGNPQEGPGRRLKRRGWRFETGMRRSCSAKPYTSFCRCLNRRTSPLRGTSTSRPSGSRPSIRTRTAVDRQKIATLQPELRKADERLSKLYEAMETEILPLAKASRENVLIEIAGVRRQTLPVERILPSQVEAFGAHRRSPRIICGRSSTRW